MGFNDFRRAAVCCATILLAIGAAGFLLSLLAAGVLLPGARIVAVALAGVPLLLAMYLVRRLPRRALLVQVLRLSNRRAAALSELI